MILTINTGREELVIKIWWPSLWCQVQVNGTSACKRKHPEETEGSSEEGSCSGCRLREMKSSGKSRTLQGAVFWPSAWRTKLCTCTDCKVQIKNTHYRGDLLDNRHCFHPWLTDAILEHKKNIKNVPSLMFCFLCLGPLCRCRSVFPHGWDGHCPGVWKQG